VSDKNDNSAISFAAVYINGTFVGVLADKDGNFELDISKYPLMPLTISSIGYYSITLKDFSTDEPLIIKLTPKEFKVKEVVVSSKSLARQRLANLKVFLEIFLGKTVNAKACEITNIKDITFNYNSDRDTLKAFASKPIIINNISLGYKITYYLDKFEYYRQTQAFIFNGNIFFNDDVSNVKNDTSLHIKRKLAYLGSRMHFFRTLWTGDSIKDEFIVRDSARNYLYYKDFITKRTPDSINSHSKYLKHSGSLWINYHNRITKLIFLKKEVYFNQDGSYDQQGILWEGWMVNKRTGDELPYNYIDGQ
jgi:hypothetical protein